MYDENELPEFEKRALSRVNAYVQSIFGKNLVDLVVYDDHHFRAIFKGGYFSQPEGWVAPSKSQWGTLKKKFKRRDKQVFIFRESGELSAEDRELFAAKLPDETLYFIDFGFFKYD